MSKTDSVQDVESVQALRSLAGSPAKYWCRVRFGESMSAEIAAVILAAAHSPGSGLSCDIPQGAQLAMADVIDFTVCLLP